eukprot:TRINITY_DN9640_c0_g1_i1.p1 TRINITY_DN9640_c0_g1~~TRINITY_DN9640_c0_g1_i1.p1  ORF type:complete len:2276 (+),score=290.72 TRINITY_DN9640_c0_g1_i1:1085-7912(+)
MRKRDMSCGIAPARFVFRTSDIPDYDDENENAMMQIVIECKKALFVSSKTCENVLDATGGFPSIDTCLFGSHKASMTLRTRLDRDTRYSMTLKLVQPAGRWTAAENSYEMSIVYYNKREIEKTRAPVDIIHIIPNAKVEETRRFTNGNFYTRLQFRKRFMDSVPPTPAPILIGGPTDAPDLDAQFEEAWNIAEVDGMNGYSDDYNTRGYITMFQWKPAVDPDYKPLPGVTTKFTFGIRSFGTMNADYAIDIIAYPTDIWRFGEPGEGCLDFDAPPGSKATCQLRSFPGALATESNGFRINVGTTSMINLGSDGSFSLQLRAPPVGTACNMYWTATSFRKAPGSNLPLEPFTVWLDKPIYVLGAPNGIVAHWELAATSVPQWVTLEFTPGNTLIPSKEEDQDPTGIYNGLIIIPPANFTVLFGSSPLEPSLEYNSVPCLRWPKEDMKAGRWGCPLAEKAIFRDTTYRVLLRIINPPRAGQAMSWRMELWQGTNTRPVSVTRGLRGMPISGQMKASLAQENQLLAGTNVLRIDFTPSQDVGTSPDTSLAVVAPRGFRIIKRCNGFKPIILPLARCEGSDKNSFRLVFPEPDAIKRGTSYVFEIEVDNPSENVPDEENYWTFDTMRPDRIVKDTARFPGFFMYPNLFHSFRVTPVSRRVGAQFVIVRFISMTDIPFDDYIRVRAPVGANWSSTNLGYDTSNSATDAWDFLSSVPVIDFNMQNVMSAQLTSTCKANLEYGIRARLLVPQVTPVPNRWWIEQYRKSGDPAPNNWRYIASMGAEGFQSQVLINVQVTPMAIVSREWRNPTLFTFEATVTVYPVVKTTPLGPVTMIPEFFVLAPPDFTYICPVTTTYHYPKFSTPVPPDVKCNVNHNDLSVRNQLSLEFPGGIQKGVRYAFSVDVENAEYVDPITNFWMLQTRLAGEVIEEAKLPGYLLATRLDDTRYLRNWPQENRRVDAVDNRVVFIIGTIAAYPFPTFLEVRAPRGFVFAFDCTTKVGQALEVPVAGPATGAQAGEDLPPVEVCQNLMLDNVEWTFIARIALKAGWGHGNHALYVHVTNPTFTPKMNLWAITIFDRNMNPVASESRISGFEIMVVLEPQLMSYNPGNGVPGEAAINRVELSFMLTTQLPPPNVVEEPKLVLTAPKGFRFPNVCRHFYPDVKKAGLLPLPALTYCQGNNADQLTLTLPPFRTLEKHPNRYAFRFLVINPSTTFSEAEGQTNPEKWWKLETRRQNDELVDKNAQIMPFPILQRLHYFVVDTLSRVGMNSTIFRVHFKTDKPLQPQHKIVIYPPLGTKFYGVRDGACRDEDPMLLARLFPKPLIRGVTRLPEYVSCQVVKEDELVLMNTESVLGGRPLIAGPVFEFFVKNSTNAQSTPDVNLFIINAFTGPPTRKEVWVSDGWIIFPELLDTYVSSSNPGFGLYSTFTISLKSVTEVGPRGSVVVEAPDDYYFGPMLTTPETAYNPLRSMPPPQGESPERPPPDEWHECEVLRPPDWYCPFDFEQCRVYADLKDLKDIGVQLRASDLARMNSNNVQCQKLKLKCTPPTTTSTTLASQAGAWRLSDILKCRSRGTMVELLLQDYVILPPLTTMKFWVRGYNARRDRIDPSRDTWTFKTLDSDTEKTVLDRKTGVPGLTLLGIVAVPSIVPADTKVGSIENYVTITVVLTFTVPAPGILRITFPFEYRRNPNAAFQGSAIETGDEFPRQVEKRQTVNVVEIEALEEEIPANTPLKITLGLSNPPISPVRENNIWMLEALSKSTGVPVLLNCNYFVEGFKIFGEFAKAAIAGSVLSPTVENIVAPWFILKSDLATSESSQMKIWMPRGFIPKKDCGGAEFQRSYNPFREGVKYPHPPEKNYIEIYSGTYCENFYDPVADQHAVLLQVEGIINNGFDYAFEFVVINPRYTPPPEENLWRFETLRGGVILHLQENIPGFTLEEIKEVKVTPQDTTTLLPLNRIEFYMMSDKRIPGGSKIVIRAPRGYIFTCTFFRTDEGLSNTTTCYVDQNSPNVAEFTVDSQDPKDPLTPFTLSVLLSNPEFTPQDNYWGFDITSPLGKFIDIRDFYPGFEITGTVKVKVRSTFPYMGETNPLRIDFEQSTIMNQADNGNEIMVTAPLGYNFQPECTGFYLRLKNPKDVESEDPDGYPATYSFPPPGITCQGKLELPETSDPEVDRRSTVTVRLPNGQGLLRNIYTLEIDVVNPGFQPETPNIWEFITRVRNPTIGQRIVDANRTLEGFSVTPMVPLRTVESAARPLRPFVSRFLSIAGPASVGIAAAVVGSASPV